MCANYWVSLHTLFILMFYQGVRPSHSHSHNTWLPRFQLSNPISFHKYNLSVFVIFFFPISVLILRFQISHTGRSNNTPIFATLRRERNYHWVKLNRRHTWLVNQVLGIWYNDSYIVVFSLHFDGRLPEFSGVRESTHIHVNVWCISEICVLTHLWWFFQSDSRQRVPTLLQPRRETSNLYSFV